MNDAEKREKAMRGLEFCSQQRGGPELCEQCPYNNDPFPCGNALLQDALALLKERGSKVKPQFDDDALDRNAYIKVGDLIDCMTELSMPEDAAFHLTGAIEWACGKRAVALLREQEPRILTLGEAIEGKNGLEIDPYVFVEIKGREDIFIGSVSNISHYNYPDPSFRVGESFKINRNFPGKIYLNTDYMKTVRCWTHKPSKEQREVVKWDD